MSRVVFIDTYYLLAVANRHDAGHARAVAWGENFSGRLLVTQWVLAEFADALCHAAHRTQLVAIIRTLLNSTAIEVVTDNSLFERGFALYSERPDKNWSLTDCISFAVMTERSIREAWTADRHFEQAGFAVLLDEG